MSDQPGADKFMDGTETYKYSPLTSSETARQMHGIVDGFDELKSDVNEFKELEDQHYQETKDKAERAMLKATEGYDRAKRNTDSIGQVMPTIMRSATIIAPMMLLILCSRPMRLINWFTHWYAIIITADSLVPTFTKEPGRVPRWYIDIEMDYSLVTWENRHEQYRNMRKMMRKYKASWRKVVRSCADTLRMTEIRVHW
ncbi:hypothetical protein [uncultured Duncaniella sp.]|uniref:hypothetical protein n=1 Tax=uncultured Duncaniella sp. TaxID=2768039 RepID=UPI002612BE2E|nr:hypothetical protein [uncultured Duncaniella sp.]